MAKKSVIERNAKRLRCIENNKKAREELLKVAKSKHVSMEDRIEAFNGLQRMKKDSAPVRYRNMCFITGRTKGFYRKFGVSRIKLRELVSFGLIAGLKKYSW